jgi:hypothetical protein
VGRGESRCEQRRIDIRDGFIWLIGCAGEIVSQGSAQNRKDLSKHGRTHMTRLQMARSVDTSVLNDNNRSRHRRPIMPAWPGISSAVVRPWQLSHGNSTRGARDGQQCRQCCVSCRAACRPPAALAPPSNGCSLYHCLSGTPVRVQKSVILRQPPLFLCGSLRRQTTGNVARVARDSLLFLFPDCSYMLVISIARLVFLRRILPRPARDWDFRGRRPGCHACLLSRLRSIPLHAGPANRRERVIGSWR